MTKKEMERIEKNLAELNRFKLKHAQERIRRLENALDNLKVQGIRGMVQHWVAVPEVEWDSIFKEVWL